MNWRLQTYLDEIRSLRRNHRWSRCFMRQGNHYWTSLRSRFSTFPVRPELVKLCHFRINFQFMQLSFKETFSSTWLDVHCGWGGRTLIKRFETQKQLPASADLPSKHFLFSFGVTFYALLVNKWTSGLKNDWLAESYHPICNCMVNPLLAII